MKTSTFTWRKIKTDAKVKFYTGINTIVLFNKIFRLIQTFLSDLIYWKGPKHAKNCSKVSHRRRNTSKKLSQHDEFLLTLMRLRLGLLVREIAEVGKLAKFNKHGFWIWQGCRIRQGHLHYTDAGKILPLKICGSVIGSTGCMEFAYFSRRKANGNICRVVLKFIVKIWFYCKLSITKKCVILIGASVSKTNLLSSKSYRYQLLERVVSFFSIKKFEFQG